jgi:ATP-binding cassette subfamily C (CFTR/MRP) protein 1
LKASFRENHQEGSKRPLIKAIFQTFRTDIVIGAVASLLSSVLLVLVPFVVKFIILFSAHAYEAHKLGTKGPPIGHGVGLVIGISLMQILGSIGMNHFFYRGMVRDPIPHPLVVGSSSPIYGHYV